MKRVVAIAVLMALLLPQSAHAVTRKGPQGQTISVKSTTVKDGSIVTVIGNHFDETVGIYLAFCVIPAQGKAPTPCGGGVNKAGLGEASFWISSNPPPYAIGLTEEFLPGGRFTHKVKVSKVCDHSSCRSFTQ